MGFEPPESVTAADGCPLGWLAIVRMLRESRMLEFSCSWFCRCTVNWLEPWAQLLDPFVAGKTIVGEGADLVVDIGIPRNDG